MNFSKGKKWKKIKGNANNLNIIMLIAAFAITAIAIITGSYVNDTENMTVGSVSSKRYVATRTIENVMETEKLKAAAAEAVGPLYKHDPAVQEGAIKDVDEFFATLDATLKKMEEEVQKTDTAETEAPEKSMNFNLDLVLKIPVAVSEQQAKSYYELTETGKKQFRDNVVTAVEFAFDQRITEETMESIKEQAAATAEETLWKAPLKVLAKTVIVSVLEPNFIIDEEAMLAAKEQNVAGVQPVMVLKNQKIVDEGEIVTEEAFNILNELGLINKSYTGSVIPFVGGISIVLMGFVAVYVYMKTQQQKLLDEKNKIAVIFALYMFTVLIISIMADMNTYYFIPVSVFAMLMAILIKPKIALILNLFASLSALFIFNGGVDFLVYWLITGSFAGLLIQYTNRRTRILSVSLAVGAIHTLAYISVKLFFVKDFSIEVIQNGMYAGVIGLGSVIVVVGSLPLWEAMFGINTQYRLMELANPNNDIMRRLMIETPGTYHHCLIVANLAETASYDIYANGALARVGAYYHDIGKLANPQCFSENQFGENIHDSLDPYISAKMIIEHVKNGVEMAHENRVPKVVSDIIEQHHGTTLVKYFYFKSTKEKPEVEIDEGDFRYKGPVPQFKESAIVMLADTVEAAVRSSLGSGKTIDEVSKLIDTLFKDKLSDGQLNDCRLDLKELEIIKKSFLKVFNGMYHDRIAYPKIEEIEAARKEQQLMKKEAVR